jgi:hypothetical protein
MQGAVLMKSWKFPRRRAGEFLLYARLPEQERQGVLLLPGREKKIE